MNRNAAAIVGFLVLAWQLDAQEAPAQKPNWQHASLPVMKAVYSEQRAYNAWWTDIVSADGRRAVITVDQPASTVEFWRGYCERNGLEFFAWNEVRPGWDPGVVEVYSLNGRLKKRKTPVYRAPAQPAMRYVPPVQSVSPPYSSPRIEVIQQRALPLYSAPAATYWSPAPVYSLPQTCGPGGCR